ncbi:MAG: hypothetical protein ICV68_04100 [Pyrinomonadaceae bacterium]|nr:hypothetical protein [Pyrinomonadaceae bacterium]
MQDAEIRQLDRDQRVRVFAVNIAASIPAGSRGAQLATALDAKITEAETQAAKQDAATLDRQESTEQKRVAINTLKGQMRAMNRTARSIDEQMPGIADQFKMPTDSDQAVLNRARAFIEAATPIPNEFTSRGFPASFLTDMQATIDAVDQAEDRQSAALAAQTAATKALAVILKQLREIIRELDSIIRNLFRNDPATLAAWESASHIESGPTKKETPPPPTP